MSCGGQFSSGTAYKHAGRPRTRCLAALRFISLHCRTAWLLAMPWPSKTRCSSRKRSVEVDDVDRSFSSNTLLRLLSHWVEAVSDSFSESSKSCDDELWGTVLLTGMALQTRRCRPLARCLAALSFIAIHCRIAWLMAMHWVGAVSNSFFESSRAVMTSCGG